MGRTGLAVLAACLAPTTAAAVPRATVDALLQDLQEEVQMSTWERLAVRPLVLAWVARDGDMVHVERLMVEGLDQGCWGPCLPALVVSAIRGMDLGIQDSRAVTLTLEALQAAAAPQARAGQRWSAAELGQWVALRAEQNLQEWIAER